MKPATLACIIVILIVTAFVGLPWLNAYGDSQGELHAYGLMGGRDLACTWNDGTHFDRYHCIIHEMAESGRIGNTGKDILVGGKRVAFPEGKNTAILMPDGQLRFTNAGQDNIIRPPDHVIVCGASFLWGVPVPPVPDLKEWRPGAPEEEFVKANFPAPR